MTTPDDDLRDLFARGRAEDREAAPVFEAMWEHANQGPAAPKSHRRWALAAVAAAACVAAFLIWSTHNEGASVGSPDPQVAVVVDDESAQSDEIVQALASEELASWEPERFDAPTDFLLESDGVLSGGMPADSDSTLDFEELTMEL